MEKNKHKPPSRKRYEKNYPVWSVRMSKEWIGEMELLLENTEQSRRDFLGVALKKQKVNYKRAYTRWYNRGYYEGYDKGKSDWRIWHFCSVCGGTIYIIQNSNSHKALIGYMNEHGWGHRECHKKKSSDTY